jgi:hypothetical protein
MRRSIYLAKLSGLLSYFVYSEFFGVRAAGAHSAHTQQKVTRP